MRIAFCIQQDVPRFDVTMENSMFMRVMHGASYFRNQFRGLSDRHRRALGYFIQLPAFDELHAEITRAIALTDFVNGDDARMIEACGGFGLPAKPFQMRFARPLTKADYF